jgi:hypothetical protein
MELGKMNLKSDIYWFLAGFGIAALTADLWLIFSQ